MMKLPLANLSMSEAKAMCGGYGTNMVVEKPLTSSVRYVIAVDI